MRQMPQLRMAVICTLHFITSNCLHTRSASISQPLSLASRLWFAPQGCPPTTDLMAALMDTKTLSPFLPALP